MFRFIWPIENLSPDLLQALRHAPVKPVISLEGQVGTTARSGDLSWLETVDVALEYCLPPDLLQDTTLLRLFHNKTTMRLWLVARDVSPELPDQVQQFGADRIGWIVSSITELQAILAFDHSADCIALKGNEAAGIVGPDSMQTLYAAATDWLARTGRQVRLYVWGGIAMPEAAAAFLATGASGVFFESVHWLTDLSGLDDSCRVRIAQLRPDHTRLVGQNLPNPCRVFDKGNSRAAKAAMQTSLVSETAPQWLDYLRCHLISPNKAGWNRDELIPLGVEATFAAAFVRRFGADFVHAVSVFSGEVQQLLQRSDDFDAKYIDSPVAKTWGTKLPIIQGGMSWITDSPEFAAAVAKAGALPTLAMGMLDAAGLQLKFSQLPQRLQGAPYAVNLITLAENPHRQSQQEWILANRPRFAVIAAGEPAQGKPLLAAGIELIYIAPNEELLRLALEAGYRYVLCEGGESGGHVGIHSTLTLAQLAIDLKLQRPELFAGASLILAGGICNRLTAKMAAFLGADAIQLGTAYLTTREIVETGALSSLYQQQILVAANAATVVTGESVGLRVRALRNNKTAAILQLEKQAAGQRGAEQTLRHQLEKLATGSLLLAARQLDARTGQTVEPAVAVAEGQFMSGACAGILNQPISLNELHEAVTGASPAPQEKATAERIAITGMSLVNALGNSPAEIWQACCELRSGIVAVPQEKWNHQRYFDAKPMLSGKTYCRVAAFADITVNRRDIDVPPQDFKNMTTATKLALWTARQAVTDAGILQSAIDRQRIGVILSQNATEMTPISGDLAVRDAIPEILAAVSRVIEINPDQAAAMAEEIAAGRRIQDDTSLLGRLSSMVPGFVCNQFGFTGPSYSVLAACASSLVALHSAVQLIKNGVLDAAVVGGAEEPLSAMHFLEFSVLGALAGLSGHERPPAAMSRPFDRDRDGFVMGEGAGMLVLERESVAKQRGARIYGYVTGVGASNTETGMVESSRQSQIRAIKASFAGLPYGPESVDLVECHATATRQGDMEEVCALQAVYPSDKRTVLAGFKSQVGHTLGAAGVNSLIRGVMAMNAGVFPPTLNCEQPDPAIDWSQTGFAVLDRPQEWKLQNGQPRRLQVDAFGFGGSNFVVQLEQAADKTLQGKNVSTDTPVWIKFEGVQLLDRKLAETDCRLAIVAESRQAAEKILQHNNLEQPHIALTDKKLRALARQGIHLQRADAPQKLALVFPGQGSQYVGMGKELYTSFAPIRELLQQASEHFGFDLPHLLFESTEETLRDTRWQQPAVFALDVAIGRLLLAGGLKPVAMAGHSLGQFAALCVAGAFSFADGCKIVNQRALCMEKAARLAKDPGAMLAVHAAREVVDPYLKNHRGVFLLNNNSPRQTVVGGDTSQSLLLADALAAAGIRATRLPVSMAFHAPGLQSVADEFAATLADVKFSAPLVPVLSNHQGGVIPAAADEIRRLLAEHLYSPVDWLGNVQSLRQQFGAELFVEAGPRETLGNLIRDSIAGAECLPTCLPTIETTTLQQALAGLYAAGCLPGAAFLQQAGYANDSKTDPPVAAGVDALAHVEADPATLAAVIEVIIQTTGYEPDEVAADMDLRDDLAIRSSRLPVIADALENRFGIKLDLQDFAGVRTVRDIAGRIVMVREKRGGKTLTGAAGNAGLGRSGSTETGKTADANASQLPQRIVFAKQPVRTATPDYLKFAAHDRIGIYCPLGGRQAALAAAAVLKRDHGAALILLEGPEQAGADLAGLLIWIDGQTEAAEPLLADSFRVIQAFLLQPTPRAVLLLQPPAGGLETGRILFEGIQGLLLSAAWEYRSVLFRAIRCEQGHKESFESLLRLALDQNLTPLGLTADTAGLNRTVGIPTALVSAPPPKPPLDANDVVVIAGASGILQAWAIALTPVGCRVVLLGRSVENAALVSQLEQAGCLVTYFSCDVTCAAATRQVMDAISQRFGRVSVLVHGAGILRDNYLPQLSDADFTAVVQVKLRGLQNLFQAAVCHGLRSCFAVSSVAAALGNPGQTAYAAANRAMSACLDLLQQTHPQVRCQSLLLGPVAGGGMADNEEIRQMMRWSGYSYIQASEVAQLFCRELAEPRQQSSAVLLVKDMPEVPRALALKQSNPIPAMDPAGLPLLQQIDLDLSIPALTATRTFAATTDLWLPQHRPLTGLKHPLVSGIMIVEMFAEAAQTLYPYLSLQAMQNVKFVDPIECPAEVPRLTRLDCIAGQAQNGLQSCALKMSTQEVSPSGRLLQRWSHNASATALLGSDCRLASVSEAGFPLGDRRVERQMKRPALLRAYKRFTALTGRYRVLHELSRLSTDSVEAIAVLPRQADFADRRQNGYLTLPYLLEAVFQTAVFQRLLQPRDRSAAIALPYAIGELRYHPAAAPLQGPVRIQARKVADDAGAMVWDAVAYDERQQRLLSVNALELRWICL